MKWSKEEAADGVRAYWAGGEVLPLHVRIQRAMTRAVELAAARGGTMTAEDLLTARMNVERWISQSATAHPHTSLGELATHIAAQGARVAVLEAENTRLRASADELQRYKEDMGKALDSTNAAARELMAERDALKSELATVNEHLAALRAGGRAALEQLAHALGWKDGGPGWQAAIDEVKRLRANADGFARIHALLFVALSSFLKNHPAHVRPDHHGWILGWDMLEALHAALSGVTQTCNCRIRNIACIHEAMRYRNPPAPSESSGQVAEDEALLQQVVSLAAPFVGKLFANKTISAHGHADTCRTILSRLAAGAQTLAALRATRWKCECGRPVNLAAIIDAVKENP